MNKKFKYIFFIFIFLMLIIPSNKLQAKTLNDMNKELAELKARKNTADNQKKLTKAEINNIAESITNTTAEIENTRNEVVKANENIETSKKEIETKKEETKELLKFLQKSGGENVYLEYIMEADSYTELIYRYSVVNQISNYNTKVMTDLENMIKKLEASKIELAEKEKKLQAQRIELNNKRASLGNQLSSYEETATTIEEDIADLQAEIKYYRDELGCSLNQDINVCVQIAYSNSFRYPLVSSYVTSLYGDRWGSIHRGQDYGAAEGTKVYSVANGVVARITERSTCGGNIVYIYHNVKSKNYTSVYMHLLSINVKKGDRVTSDTVIGLSGGGKTTMAPKNTCNLPGGKGYDRCTCGAHLHFGIAEGHNATAFNTYSFNPQEIFPKLTTEYSSRWSAR